MADFWDKLPGWFWYIMPYIITVVMLAVFPVAKWATGWEIHWGWIAGISVVFMIICWVVIMFIMVLSKGFQ